MSHNDLSVRDKMTYENSKFTVETIGALIITCSPWITIFVLSCAW